MPVTPLRERVAWKALQRHHAEIAGRHLRDLLAEDPGRGERPTAEAAGIYLDYAKNLVTDETREGRRSSCRCRPSTAAHGVFAASTV